jgi:uncharacterized membrane protein YuzA (DUF378 family)
LILLSRKKYFIKIKSMARTYPLPQEEVMKSLDIVAAVLVVVGALNWGFVAVARFDLVAALFGMRFGEVSPLSAVVYGLVGLAGAYQAMFWKRVQTRWAEPSALHAR